MGNKGADWYDETRRIARPRNPVITTERVARAWRRERQLSLVVSRCGRCCKSSRMGSGSTVWAHSSQDHTKFPAVASRWALVARSKLSRNANKIKDLGWLPEP